MPAPNSPFPPMEAELVRELPEADGWQYEPKWDGFRGVFENEGGELAMWSRTDRTRRTAGEVVRDVGAVFALDDRRDRDAFVALERVAVQQRHGAARDFAS